MIKYNPRQATCASGIADQPRAATFRAGPSTRTCGLANAAVAPELRMKLTGHSSEAIHRGYTHHGLEVLKSAVSKLPSIGAWRHGLFEAGYSRVALRRGPAKRSGERTGRIAEL